MIQSSVKNGKRTPHGSNSELKEKRSRQTAAIKDVLNKFKDKLATVQDIIKGVWVNFEEKKELEL